MHKMLFDVTQTLRLEHEQCVYIPVTADSKDCTFQAQSFLGPVSKSIGRGPPGPLFQ